MKLMPRSLELAWNRWLVRRVERSGMLGSALKQVLAQSFGWSLGSDPNPALPDQMTGNKGWAFAVNRQIGGRAGRVPISMVLKTRVRGRSVKSTPVHDHPFLDLMAQPNPTQSGMVFHWKQVIQLNTTGRSYVLVLPEVLDSDFFGGMVLSRVKELNLLYPDRVTPRFDAFDRVFEYWYATPGGGREIIQPAPTTYAEREAWKREPYPFVYGVQIPAPDSGFGYSPMKAAESSVKVDEQLNELFYNQLKNGIHSSLVFYLKKDIEDVERFEKAVLMVKQGVGKAGDPMVLPQKTVEIAQAPLSNDDMKFPELEQSSRRRILAALGGSDGVVGMVTDVNRASLEGLERLIAIGTIDPLNDLIADGFNSYVMPLFRGQSDTSWYECYYASSATADEVTQAQILNQYVGGGIMTPNEAREELEMEPVDGGDKLKNVAAEKPDLGLVPDGANTPTLVPSAPAPGQLPATVSRETLPAKNGNSNGKAKRDKTLVPIDGHPLATDAGRAARWHDEDRKRRQWERAFRRGAVQVFSRWRDTVCEELLKGGSGIVRGTKTDAWAQVLVQQYVVDLQPVGEAALAAGLSEFGAQDVDEATVEELVKTLKHVGASWAKRMADGQVKRIRSAMQDAVDEQLPPEEMAELVAETFPTSIYDRTIKNTGTAEVSYAHGVGTFYAARELKRKRVDKVPALMWLSMRDDRVRDTHVIADGQIIRVGEQFEVGDCHMFFPGDRDSCPLIEEWINCRCVSVLVQAEEAEIERSSAKPDRKQLVRQILDGIGAKN